MPRRTWLIWQRLLEGLVSPQCDRRLILQSVDDPSRFEILVPADTIHLRPRRLMDEQKRRAINQAINRWRTNVSLLDYQRQSRFARSSVTSKQDVELGSTDDRDRETSFVPRQMTLDQTENENYRLRKIRNK